MSEKNRKAEYDRLVSENKKIPEVLVNEFGDPLQEAKVDEVDQPGAADQAQEEAPTSDETENKTEPNASTSTGNQG